jgi:hypothetical protein
VSSTDYAGRFDSHRMSQTTCRASRRQASGHIKKPTQHPVVRAWTEKTSRQLGLDFKDGKVMACCNRRRSSALEFWMPCYAGTRARRSDGVPWRAVVTLVSKPRATNSLGARRPLVMRSCRVSRFEAGASGVGGYEARCYEERSSLTAFEDCPDLSCLFNPPVAPLLCQMARCPTIPVHERREEHRAPR